jgi:hypothetical protein
VAAPIPIVVVTPEIIIPVVMNSFKRVPAKGIGYMVVISRCPRPVIVRRRIPCVPAEEIEEIAHEEKIIRNPYRHIKSQFRRLYKFRRFLYYHRLGSVYGCTARGDTDINPQTESDIVGISLRNRH